MRPLEHYGDRLMSELARVLGDSSLSTTERVVVSASPKVELMLIAGGLTSNWALTKWVPLNDPRRLLQHSATEHFFDHRNHPAVVALYDLSLRRGFSHDAWVRLALSFSDPPSLEQVYPLADYLVHRAGGDREALLELAVRLQGFAVESDFAAWWEKHENDYKAIEDEWKQVIEARDLLGTLETYFGQWRFDALAVIPSGFVAGGFGGTIQDPEGTWALACIGPAAAGVPVDEETLEFLVYHEVGHSFVDVLAEEHSELVKRYEKLYYPIEDRMSGQSYTEWHVALNEHVLRACHSRICLAEKGEAAAEEILAKDEALGFKYVRVLFEKLAEYEANRDAYPDFRSFYPELLLALDRYL